uniref:ATP synthase F0 subunit beta n=1 Tax=Prasinococcus sp. CCMP1194 TaxID=110672 RepID=A0A650AKU1_9VIRI|nr:ATP synthase F0 subunit beta [Prasinococcus sp. CCMP1194]
MSPNSIFLSGLLVVCALISKQFLLINEETLVALCFCAFVFAAIRYGSGMVQEMLEAQQNEISQSISQGSIAHWETMQARLVHATKIQDALTTFATQATGLQAYLEESLLSGSKKDKDLFLRFYDAQLHLLSSSAPQDRLKIHVPQLIRELILLNPSVPSVLLNQSFATLHLAGEKKEGKAGSALPAKKVVLS